MTFSSGFMPTVRVYVCSLAMLPSTYFKLWHLMFLSPREIRLLLLGETRESETDRLTRFIEALCIINHK